ncbi:hypothetical protein QP980_11325 [Corynebacterium coyleae]|nr:hypothetical protein [Corynebacterium coyleae]MDK8824439.1 hypothetical protein [Corynebacterium coyleae]
MQAACQAVAPKLGVSWHTARQWTQQARRAGNIPEPVPEDLAAENARLRCQMRVFGTGVPETRYCCVPGSWYRGRADGVGPAVCLIRPVLLGRWPCACRSLRCGFGGRC